MMQVANRGVRQRGGAFYDPTAYSYFDLPADDLRHGDDAPGA